MKPFRSFHARGQGMTEYLVIVSLIAVAANVALKFALYRPLGAAGLALATAVGAWINFGLLVALALRGGSMKPDATLAKVGAAVAVSSAVLAAVALLGNAPVARVAEMAGSLHTEAHLALLGLLGMAAYGVILLIALRLLGVRLARVKRPPLEVVR